MPVKPKKPTIQQSFDFENPLPQLINWPDNALFPLNLKGYLERRTVLFEITKDINGKFRIPGGHRFFFFFFFSVAWRISSNFLGGNVNFEKLSKVRIVLGFEPELRIRKFWKSAELDKDIKDYWADQHYSLLNGGEVIRVIELVKSGKIFFRLTDGLHAKIYVGDLHAILGSANFSRNGLVFQQEANIRIANDAAKPAEQKQYEQIAQIANNFYALAKDYNPDIEPIQAIAQADHLGRSPGPRHR